MRLIHMKLSKLLLAVVAAAVLLGAFVSSASARNFSTSEQRNTALWRVMNFIGGFGTVECEVKLSGSLHTRTASKTVNSLIGYVTEGTVLRCARGGATINQASFPWHRRYRSFTGTLPNITGQSETVTGAEWTIQEPAFEVTCTVRRETSSTIGTYSVSSGTITRAEVSGESPCLDAFRFNHPGRLAGSETNVTNGAGARITVRLI
jgi:hypothetical protein